MQLVVKTMFREAKQKLSCIAIQLTLLCLTWNFISKRVMYYF